MRPTGARSARRPAQVSTWTRSKIEQLLSQEAGFKHPQENHTGLSSGPVYMFVQSSHILLFLNLPAFVWYSSCQGFQE